MGEKPKANDLFLLMLNLSQVSLKEKIVDIFLEAITEIWPDITASFTVSHLENDNNCLGVYTAGSHYGFIRIDQLSELQKEDRSLLHNACGLLAIILKKNEQERLLADENLHLQKLVAERAEHLNAEIQDRKRVDEALRENEKKYRRLVEKAAVGVYQVTKEGGFRFVNEKMAQMFGYDNPKRFLAEVVTIADLYVRPQERPALLREMDENGSIYGREVEFRKKDDGSLWVALSSRGIREEGQSCYEGLMEDITERKRAEIEKEKLQSQLQQSRKMEAVGTLAGGIAHDFNNILAVILGNAELASSDVPDWNPASKSLKAIHKASLRAKDMVQKLLAFSRKSDGEIKPLSLAPVIKESNTAPTWWWLTRG